MRQKNKLFAWHPMSKTRAFILIFLIAEIAIVIAIVIALFKLIIELF